ncbi:MAG TPA: branched-chain amino acid ABC transporter permease [Mycobacteriales bacterium]
MSDQSRIPALPRRVGAVVAAVAVGLVVITLPSHLNGYSLYILTEVAIYAIACLGLTVVIGWSGQVALAHAGFFGLGAYGTAYLHAHGVPWLMAVGGTALAAAVIGVLIGLPAARLRGFYLAIATLAFGDLMGRVFKEWKGFTGGSEGTAVFPVTLGSMDYTVSLWYLSVGILTVSIVVLWHVGRTRWGRCLRAVRDIEIATGSLGLSALRYKVEAFAVSGFLGAVAGGLFGQAITFITPQSFSVNLVIEFLIVVLVGGVDRIAGAVVGAAFLVVVQEVLQSAGAYQRLVFGLSLVVIVWVLPRGVAPLVQTTARRLFTWRGSAGLSDQAAGSATGAA